MRWPDFSLALVVVCSIASIGCSDEASSGWSAAQEIDSRSPAAFPLLAVGGDASSLAVWQGPNPESEPVPPESFRGIYAAWKPAGGGWGSVEVLDGYRALPDLQDAAAGPQGEGIVVWGEGGTRDVPAAVFASLYERDRGWSTPESIGDGRFDAVQAAIGPEGQTFVAWARRAPSSNEICLREYTAEDQWMERDSIPVDPSVIVIDLAVDRNGRVAIAYWDSSIGVVANRFTPGSGWGLGSAFTDDELFGIPEVDIDAAGTVWAFWPGREVDGSCEGAVRNTADGWEAPTRFDTGCTSGTGGAVSADDFGGAVVVWGQGFSDEARAYWSRYVVGEGWSAPAAAPVGEGFGPTSWGLGARSNGSAAAVWYRPSTVDGDENARGPLAIWASELGPQGEWTAAQRLSELGPTMLTDPRLVPPRVQTWGASSAVSIWVGEQVERQPTIWSSSR
jgi:hypothetical protein